MRCVILFLLLASFVLSQSVAFLPSFPDSFSVMSQRERSFIAIKPDGVQRGLVGEIIARFEKRGFKLVALKYFVVPRELAEAHYAEHKGKGFFNGLVDFLISAPLVAMVFVVSFLELWKLISNISGLGG